VRNLPTILSLQPLLEFIEFLEIDLGQGKAFIYPLANDLFKVLKFATFLSRQPAFEVLCDERRVFNDSNWRLFMVTHTKASQFQD
jgi:hypothetical protein